MLPAENLDLSSSRTKALNEAIGLFWLPTRLSDLRHDDIGIQTTVRPGRKLQRAVLVKDGFHTDQHVFFCVIQPMACTPCPDYTLQLNIGRPSDDAQNKAE